MENKKIIFSRFVNNAIIFILIALLILMPFGTFFTQIIKVFITYHEFPFSNQIILTITAWKEILLVLGLFLAMTKIIAEKKLPFKINKFDITIFLVMLVGVIYGGILIGRIDRIVFGFRYDFLVFLFYFLARAVVIKKEDILKYIKITIYLSIPIMVLGITQTLFLPKGFMEVFGYSSIESVTGNPLPPYHLVGNIVRAMGTFPGPNSLAMYMVFIFLSVLFFGKELFSKIPRCLLLLFSILTLSLTFSRGHIFSLISALVLVWMLFILLPKAKIAISNKYFNFKALIATFAIILISFLIFFGTFWLADLSANQDSAIGSVIFRETSTQMHSFMRNLAIEPIKEKPYGHGIGTAGLATTNIADGKFNPESWPVQLVFEYGWLGLIFFLTIIYSIFNLLFNLFEKVKDQKHKNATLFLATFFISIIISVNFLPSWFEVGSILWWVILGLFTGGQNIFKKENAG